MRPLRQAVGLGLAVVPVVNCAWLLYDLVKNGGSVANAEEFGLGPTLLGLGLVGLLFCGFLMWRVVRFVRFLRPPASGPRGGPDAGRPSDGDDDDGGGFAAADAVISRYLTAQPPAAAPTSAAGRPAPDVGPATRPSFGRRTR